MDVIEDFFEVLRVILDYVGVDMDDMGDYLRNLNERQRRRIYFTGRTIVNMWDQQVTQRRTRIKTSWHLWRSNIRHRSLIRIIGTALPLKPPKRIRINSRLLRRHFRDASDDGDSDDSSLFSFPGSVQTYKSEDVLEENLGDNIIRIVAKNHDLSETDSYSGDLDEEEDIFLNHEQNALLPMNSTMISSVSMSSNLDPDALKKISSLEDELASLRKQIASLVINQELVDKSMPSCKEEYSSSPDSAIHTEEEMFTPSCIPLPPPPPPPPVCPPPTTLQYTKPMTDSSSPLIYVDSSKFKNESNRPVQPIVPKHPKEAVTLKDVLKDLNSVKLRSIERSPGGTPLRATKRAPLTPRTNNDPASLIAEALKKKFASHHVYSPDVDKENENYGFSSDGDSPQVLHHKPRRSLKRRSVLLEKRKSIDLLKS